MSDDKRTIAERFAEAGLATDRFINVHDGAKKSTDHDTRYSDPREVPGQSYGVYPGGGLVDVDIDDYADGADNDGLAAILDLPETLTVESPHTDGVTGGHRYYHVVAERPVEDFDIDTVLSRYIGDDGEPTATYHAAKDDPVALTIAEAFETPNPQPSWGEVRSVRQYVVGPGSQLDGCEKCDSCADNDGGWYRVATDAPIATVTSEEFVDALRADPKLAEDGPVAAPSSDATPGVNVDASGYEPAGTPIDDVIPQESQLAKYLAAGAKAAGFESNGGGDDRSRADYYAACVAVEYGVTEEEIRNALAECGYSKVGARDAPANYWRKTWSKAVGDADVNSKVPSAESDGPDASTWDSVVSLFESDANGTTTKAYNEAAKIICRDYDFAKVRESDEFYHYVPDFGYYVRKGETYLEEILNDALGDHANANRRREIRERVEGEKYVSSDDFRPPEGKVNVENGVLDLDTRELESHSPEYYFTSQVRAEWPEDGQLDPWAEAWWLRALADSHDDPRERKKIEEFVGYSLETWHHDREKNLFLVGPPMSGKSTLQEAIEALFGSQPTVSNLTPQQIADTQFDAAALREAALNTVNDINATPIKDTGTLKRVFSGERMKLENKYKDPHFAAPNAKHLFTANWLPRLVGQDDAVYRRLLLVEFTKTIDEEDKDPEYKRRLKTDAVRQVILTRAVDARDRLHEQGGFTNDRSLNDTRKLWDSWRDGHKRFLYTQFEITGEPDDEVDKQAYWQAYREFAARKGFELMSNVAITKSLQYVPEVYASGESREAYGGLRWNDYDAAKESTPTTLTDPQDSRRRKLRRWVDEFSTPRSGATITDVLDYAEEHGIDRDQAEHDIEAMRKRGELQEPQTGVLRST